MHSLTIWFGPAATSITLLFKTEERAEPFYSTYVQAKVDGAEGNPLLGTDDFGQVIAIPISEVSGMLLEDLSLSEGALVERGLHTARAQAKAQKAAMDDPTIKAGIRAQQQGPAIYNPLGGTGGHGGRA